MMILRTQLCTILSLEVINMNFYSIRDLRTDSKKMWSDLQKGDEVIITNNGRPSAIMIEIPEGSFDEMVQTVRQAKAMIALNNMRQRAAMDGFMSDNDIENLISEAKKS